jgi:DNA anti-recombination protein RmuC
MDKRPLMEIAEYASLAGSVLGTLVAAATHQMIYSTGPLALALCLNTFNRNRLRKYVTRIPPTVEEFISPLKQEIQEIQGKQVSPLDYATEVTQRVTQQLNDPKIIQSIRQILQQSDKSQFSTSDLEKLVALQVSKAMGEQLATINKSLPMIYKSVIPGLKKLLVEQVNKNVDAQFNKVVDEVAKINELLTNIKPYEYQLIIDRSGSTAALLEAINKDAA